VSVVQPGETEKRISILLGSGIFDPENQTENERLRLLALQEFRAKLDESIAQIERGECVDGEEFMAKMLAEIDAEIEAEENS
jgi:hypothetical protein